MFARRLVDQSTFGWLILAAVLVVAVALAFVLTRGAPVESADHQEPVRGTAVGFAPDQTDAQAADTVAAPGVAWEAVDASVVESALIPDYEQVEDAVLVAMGDGLNAWEAGDLISIAVPQTGSTYTTVIDRVDTTLGRRSYLGRVAEGLPYSFVITVGERNAFAHVGTPQGTYELVGRGRFAWLMPTVNMDRHVDYSKPDYYIPERAGKSR